MIVSAPLLSIAALVATTLAFTAEAQTENARPMNQEEIDARYRSEREICERLNGRLKDICRKEAKTNRAYAEAEAKHAKHLREADREKRKAQYRLDRAYCDTMLGEMREKCILEAKRRCRY